MRTCAPWSTRPTPRSPDWARTVPHRQRLHGAGHRSRQDAGPDHHADRPIARSAGIPKVRTADSIAAWAAHMASITGQLKQNDDALAGLLAQGRPRPAGGHGILRPDRPRTASAAGQHEQPGRYRLACRADIEQLLVLFLQGTAVMSAIAAPTQAPNRDYKGICLDFNLNLNLPPTVQRRIPPGAAAPPRRSTPPTVRRANCTAGSRRTPHSTFAACATSPETVPGKRAPTVEMRRATSSTSPPTTAGTGRGDPNATLSGQDVPQYPRNQAPPQPQARLLRSRRFPTVRPPVPGLRAGRTCSLRRAADVGPTLIRAERRYSFPGRPGHCGETSVFVDIAPDEAAGTRETQASGDWRAG